MRIASTFLYLTSLTCQLTLVVDLETVARKARDAMAAGRYTDAVPLYEQMVKALPNEPGARLNLALALDGASRPVDAVRNLELIETKESANAKFWYLLGNEYLKLKQPLKAIPPLEKAVKLLPTEADYQVELAGAHLAASNAQRAAEILNPLAKQFPESPRILAQFVRTQFAISAGAYAKLLRVAPKSPFRSALDDAAADSESEKANRVMTEDPTNPLAQLFHQDDFESIIIRTATAKSAEDLYWRARASAAVARSTLARLALLPPSPEAHELAGLAYRRAARWEDSLAEYREAVALSPNDRSLQAELAKALWLGRHNEEAVTTLQPLVASDPASGDFEFELGDSLLNLGQPEHALPHLRRAAMLLPSDFAAQATLGRLLLAMGDNQAAVQALKRVADRDVEGSIHYQLANAYRNLGRTDLARRALARQKEIEQSLRP